MERISDNELNDAINGSEVLRFGIEKDLALDLQDARKERDHYKCISGEQAAKLEPYIDPKGNVWIVQTAEAYYLACTALERNKVALRLAAEEMIECPACDGRGCAKGMQSVCTGECANECWVDLWSRIANRQQSEQAEVADNG